jgi:hypothetical protein
LANTLAGGLLVMLKWRLDIKMPRPSEEMDAAFRRLVLPGVQSALEQT